MKWSVIAIAVLSGGLAFARGHAVPATAADADQPPISADSSSSDGVPPQLPDHVVDLRSRIQTCLAHHSQRLENASRRSPWGVMHTLLPFGVETQLIADGRRVNAIGWLCFNRPCRGQRLFKSSSTGLVPQEGPGLQGHKGQFLAMLAQSRVRRDFQMRVGRRDYSIADLIDHEKRTCRAGSELTFKLIGLSHYLDSDDTWKSDRGTKWSIARLIEEELEQPVLGAACGGTHRLMGYSYAVARRVREGKPIDGQWERAQTYVTEFRQYTFQLQNPDGSFSTRWLEGRADSGNLDRKLQTTGHILEWLVFSAPVEELLDPNLVRAVDFLTSVLLENPDKPWQVGPRGHALRALVLYQQRALGAEQSDRPS